MAVVEVGVGRGRGKAGSGVLLTKAGPGRVSLRFSIKTLLSNHRLVAQ